MSPEANLMMMLFANTQLQIELLDEVSNTRFYNQSYKSLINNLQKRNEPIIEGLFKNFKEFGDQEETAQIFFNQTVEAVELFKEAIQNTNIENFIVLMKAVRDGELMMFDENKHKKIAGQLKPLEV